MREERYVAASAKNTAEKRYELRTESADIIQHARNEYAKKLEKLIAY